MKSRCFLSAAAVLLAFFVFAIAMPVGGGHGIFPRTIDSTRKVVSMGALIILPRRPRFHTEGANHCAGTGTSRMLASDCSLTSSCPSCSDMGVKGHVQCCWPLGVGGGSPFAGPGFCLCSPVGRNDYSMCNGGYWVS